MNKFEKVNKKLLKLNYKSDVAFADASDSALKVHLKAKSKEAIEHPYWGKIALDLNSFTSKSRIPIDHEHETEIGYSKSMSITDYGLEIDGLVFKNKDNPQHPSNQVIFNLQNGIPSEVSVDFNGTFDIEEIPTGLSTQVNGLDLVGPAVVIKNWQLRAVAICKEGADYNTEAIAQFSADNENDFIKPNITQFKKVEEDMKAETIKVEEEVKTEEVVAGDNETEVKTEVEPPKVEEVVVSETEIKPENNNEDELKCGEKKKTELEGDEVCQPQINDDSKVIELEKKVSELEACIKELTEKNSALSAKNTDIETTLSALKAKKGSNPLELVNQNTSNDFKNKTWPEIVDEVAKKLSIKYDDAFFKAKEFYPEAYARIMSVNKK